MWVYPSPSPSPIERTVALLQLGDIEKATLTHRFLPLLAHMRSRTKRIAFFFHGSRVIITVGSLIVPALMSIQGFGTGGSYGGEITYWITWTLSLFVTICNAFLTLFKLDKRYYYLHTCLEQLTSEGWQYIELSGKYSGFNTPDMRPTHTNQFVYFSHAVEKIRMRQVEEEYFKLIDATTGAQPKPATSTIDSLLPPTPLKEDLRKFMAAAAALEFNPIVDARRQGDSRGPETQAKNAESKTDGATRAVPVQQGV